jgi:SAM-dependent methyltransferase
MTASPYDVTAIPLRFPDDAAFLALRTLLAEAGYTNHGVCAHAGVESLYDFVMRRHARSRETPIENRMDVLVRLFMDSEALPVPVIDALLGAAPRMLFESFGLLHPHPEDADARVATVLLYPTEGGPWIVSDRTVAITDNRAAPTASLQPDAVYPAITSSVRTFLSTLPVEPVARYLELCSGTGIAALLGAAGGAREAVAVDITERSTVFAAFNARLNGLSAVRALQGNLWEPVAGRQFDIIVAHPPYVAAATAELIYRDGGQDGEQVTRAILEGLSVHLAPGGVFHCTCVMSSRRGQSAPRRIRAMLGESAAEFDLIFLRNATANLTEHFRVQLMSSDPDESAKASNQLRLFGELGVESVDYCTIVLRRQQAARPGFTLQVERDGALGWAHLAWALAVGGAATDPDAFAARVLDARVRLSPEARLTVHYRQGAKGEEPWVPSGGRVSVSLPFVGAIDVGTGDAMMLARFDGTHTLREHLSALQAEGALPADVDPLVFAKSIGQLVLDGIVEISDFPLPAGEAAS